LSPSAEFFDFLIAYPNTTETTGSNSREEDHLAKIAAAEKVGVTLLAEIIECLRMRNQQTSPSDAQIKALAA